MKLIALFFIFCSRGVVANENTNIYFSQEIPKNKKQSIDFRISMFTISPFYRALGLGAGYRIKIGNNFSWKVVEYNNFSSQNLGLSHKLLEQYRISTVAPPFIKQQLLSEIIYTPLIYKWLWLDQKIVWSRIDISLGLGNSKWSELGKVSVSSLGAQFVFNLKTDRSLFWSLRNLIYDNSKIEPELEFALGTEFNF